VTGRRGALALAAGLALAGAAGPAPTAAAGLLGIGWPDWGEELTLSDLRHLVDLHPPAWVERWLYNPRERAALGIERLEAGDAEGALEAFETAGRLSPGDPRVQFDLGTGRLLADHGDAVGALERALALTGTEDAAPAGEAPARRSLPPELRQNGFFNLGNARLAAGDNAGAVAAYEEALRLDPADPAAKFNLELALRRLEDERLRLRAPREAPGGRRSGEEEPGDETGGADPEPDPEAGSQEAGQAGPEAGTETREEAAAGRRPLAGFDEQADLSAAQAAALLEAVQNLERRQRQVEARRAAREAAAEEEDW